jgi:hypothetical protein
LCSTLIAKQETHIIIARAAVKGDRGIRACCAKMDNDGDAPSDVKPNTLHATPSQWQPNEDIDLEFRPIPGEGAQPKRR